MSRSHAISARLDPMEVLLRAWFAAWTWAGVLLPVVLLLLAPPQAADVPRAALLLGLCVLGSSLEVEFAGLGDSATFTPASVGWVAAIMFLPPALAVAVVTLGELIVEAWRYRSDISVFAVSNSSLAVLVAAGAAHAVGIVPAPAGTEFLVAMAVTVTYEAMHQLTGAIATVATGRGEFYEVFVDSPIVTVFAVLMPPTALALVQPLPGGVAASSLALASVMVAAWGMLRVISLEHERRLSAERARASMSRYFAPAIVEQLVADDDALAVGGEEREISIMFCDVRGFTRFAESRTPTEVVRQLNELLAELVEVVFELEGVLDKYVGDGFMAFWGAPVDQPDHAVRAAAAARRMVDLTRDATHELRIGVGIHSGRVVVGNIGHPARVDYTAIGDAVNLASRLEGSTKQLGAPVVASDATIEMLDADARRHWSNAGSIRVAGREGAVEVHVYAP